MWIRDVDLALWVENGFSTQMMGYGVNGMIIYGGIRSYFRTGTKSPGSIFFPCAHLSRNQHVEVLSNPFDRCEISSPVEQSIADRNTKSVVKMAVGIGQRFLMKIVKNESMRTYVQILKSMRDYN